MIFLSHVLNSQTPTYGNKYKFNKVFDSTISKGDVSNNSSIETTVHAGTHIDMPFHFYVDGDTVEKFDADFWVFENPLFLEVLQDESIINEKLVDKLQSIEIDNYDILIVKTGICHRRNEESFWLNNYGFHPDIYDVIRERFQAVRVFGFDSISISSFTNRELGREAHRKFLNPENPILLLEDMKLDMVGENSNLRRIIISPLRIENCDGLPCTVFGELCD